VKGSSALVALDLTPVGELLEPTGTLSFEEAYDIFAEVIDAAEGCDLIVLETMTDLYEVRAAVLAAREHSDLPIVCTMTFEENLRTFTGCSVSAMALSLDALGVDAVGVNCSLGPEELYPVVKEIGRWTDLPVVFKPNAGLPDPMTNLFDLGAEPFAVQTARAADFGVRCFGGCCGTTDEFIRLYGPLVVGKKPHVPAAPSTTM
jgi:5-methyltetrahydrofolate--homocysteine methyltransferase